MTKSGANCKAEVRYWRGYESLVASALTLTGRPTSFRHRPPSSSRDATRVASNSRTAATSASTPATGIAFVAMRACRRARWPRATSGRARRRI